MPNPPLSEPPLSQPHPTKYSSRSPAPKTPVHPTSRQHAPLPPLKWLLLLGGVGLLAPPASGGETWGVVSMCPFHCVCRNLSESLSTLCVNKGLLFVPPDIDRRTVELRLADNFILELGGADFSNMSGLVDLTLSRNTLHRLRPLAFSDLESLRSLHLDANRLTSVGPLDLAGLLNLQHLILNNNQLGAIAHGAFAHFLPSLEDLDLSYNNLRDVPWGALRSMACLHTLNLDHNLIEHIPEGAFRELHKLGRLDMTSNRLRTLPPEPLFALHSPTPQQPSTSLSFGGNPLHCNCELLWLRRLSRPDDMETCATPAHLAGRYFWAVAEEEFTCEPPLIARHTPRLWALEGQRATLRCRALGDPPPLVHWVSPDDRILANSSRVWSYRNGTLDVLVTRARDDGTYTCIAINAAGEASAPVQLRVIPLPHHRANRTAPLARARDPEPSDISAGRGGASGAGNGTLAEDAGAAGSSGGRVGVLEVTSTTAEVRWYLGGAALDYLPWMYQIQYNSTADETLMYRILPPSSSSFQLKNLVSAADYSLCVLAVFDEGVVSLSSTRVLGCASFSTKDDFPRCRTLHAHFLGGALSVLVGGAVVVMLLVFTVATMVRHHHHQWACGRPDDRDRRNRAGGGAGEGHVQGAGSPLPAKGTSVYSQTSGEGPVMMVVLPKNKHKPTPATPKEQSGPPDRGGGGAVAGRRVPPYSPESERVTLYYPSSATLPSKLRRPGAARSTATGSPALPEPGPLRSNRSCSFDMGEVSTTTCYSYGKRLGTIWTRRSPSLQGMLVSCTSAVSMASSDSDAHTQEYLHTYDTCSKRPAPNANSNELEESVV